MNIFHPGDGKYRRAHSVPVVVKYDQRAVFPEIPVRRAGAVRVRIDFDLGFNGILLCKFILGDLFCLIPSGFIATILASHLDSVGYLIYITFSVFVPVRTGTPADRFWIFISIK